MQGFYSSPCIRSMSFHVDRSSVGFCDLGPAPPGFLTLISGGLRAQELGNPMLTTAPKPITVPQYCNCNCINHALPEDPVEDCYRLEAAAKAYG